MDLVAKYNPKDPSKSDLAPKENLMGWAENQMGIDDVVKGLKTRILAIKDPAKFLQEKLNRINDAKSQSSEEFATQFASFITKGDSQPLAKQKALALAQNSFITIKALIDSEFPETVYSSAEQLIKVDTQHEISSSS